MRFQTLVVLIYASPVFAQFLSFGSTTKNVCSSKLLSPANATGVQGGGYSYNNGLGLWTVAVSTNTSAAAIDDGRELTERSPGAIANVWLDPYQDIHLQDGSNGYSACAYIFKGLPENTIRRGQDDDTSCTQMFSQKCVDAITSRAAETAKWLVQNPTYGPFSNLTPPILEPICQQVINGIGYGGNAGSSTFPSECKPYFDYGQPSYPTTDILVLTSNVTGPRNCTFHDSFDGGGSYLVEGYNAPPGIRYPFNSTNATAVASYDELVQQVWPILTVTMPPANNSRSAEVGSTIGTMTCIKAGKIKVDSRTPAALPAARAVHLPGQLSKGAIAGIVIGAILASAIIAGASWWIWRGHRPQTQTHEPPDKKEEGAGTALHNHKDGKEVYQLEAKEKPVPLDGTGRVEIDDEHPRTELAGESAQAHELVGSTPAR